MTTVSDFEEEWSLGGYAKFLFNGLPTDLTQEEKALNFFCDSKVSTIAQEKILALYALLGAKDRCEVLRDIQHLQMGSPFHNVGVFSKIANFWKNHKKAIIIGVAVAAVVVTAAAVAVAYSGSGVIAGGAASASGGAAHEVVSSGAETACKAAIAAGAGYAAMGNSEEEKPDPFRREIPLEDIYKNIPPINFSKEAYLPNCENLGDIPFPEFSKEQFILPETPPPLPAEPVVPYIQNSLSEWERCRNISFKEVPDIALPNIDFSSRSVVTEEKPSSSGIDLNVSLPKIDIAEKTGFLGEERDLFPSGNPFLDGVKTDPLSDPELENYLPWKALGFISKLDTLARGQVWQPKVPEIGDVGLDPSFCERFSKEDIDKCSDMISRSDAAALQADCINKQLKESLQENSERARIRVCFVNGASVTPEEMEKYKIKFEKDIGQKVKFIYNPAKDALQTVDDIINRDVTAEISEVSLKISEELRQFHMETEDIPGARYYVLAHSQGAVQLGDSLRQLPKEITDKIVAIGVGPFIPLYREDCESSVNVISENDFVPMLGETLLYISSVFTKARQENYEKNHLGKTKKVVYLERDPSIKIFELDHDLCSPTVWKKVCKLITETAKAADATAASELQLDDDLRGQDNRREARKATTEPAGASNTGEGS